MKSKFLAIFILTSIILQAQDYTLIPTYPTHGQTLGAMEMGLGNISTVAFRSTPSMVFGNPAALVESDYAFTFNMGIRVQLNAAPRIPIHVAFVVKDARSAWGFGMTKKVVTAHSSLFRIQDENNVLTDQFLGARSTGALSEYWLAYSYKINYWVHVGAGLGFMSGTVDKSASLHRVPDQNSTVTTHHKLKSFAGNVGISIRLNDNITIAGHYANLLSRGPYARLTVHTMQALTYDQPKLQPIDPDFASNAYGGVGLGIRWSSRWYSLFSYEQHDNDFWGSAESWNNQVAKIGQEIYLSDDKKLLLGGHYGIQLNNPTTEFINPADLNMNDWGVSAGYSFWEQSIQWTISGRYRRLDFERDAYHIIELIGGMSAEPFKRLFNPRNRPMPMPVF